MIPKRSGRRVIPVLRSVEGRQLSLERHHYSLGVDNPQAPLSAKRGRLPVTNQVTTLPDQGGCSQTSPDKTIALTCRNTT
jgi:hypothetical protein